MLAWCSIAHESLGHASGESDTPYRNEPSGFLQSITMLRLRAVPATMRTSRDSGMYPQQLDAAVRKNSC